MGRIQLVFYYISTKREGSFVQRLSSMLTLEKNVCSCLMAQWRQICTFASASIVENEADNSCHGRDEETYSHGHFAISGSAEGLQAFYTAAIKQ